MSRRRYLVVLLTAALALGGCGGDDDDDDTATDATTTTLDPGGIVEEVTTTVGEAPGTEVEGEPDPLLEVIRSLQGGYEGTWTNTTFGSTGAAAMTVALDEAAGTVTAELDLGGNVFGASDPDPETFVITLDLNNLGNTFTVSSVTFGEVTAQLAEDGSVTIDAPDVPGSNIGSFTATARATATGWEGTYQVTFEAGGTADGTFTVAKS